MSDKTKAISFIDEKAGFFTGLSDKIWDKPELSLKEFEATEHYCAALAELGYHQAEIAASLKGIKTEGMTTEEIVRQCLRAMVMR